MSGPSILEILERYRAHMAKVTLVALADDIDDSKAAETVSFALDGIPYEIDLNAKHAKAIRKELAEFIAAARTAEPITETKPRSSGARTGPERAARSSSNTDIRNWAVAQGITIGDRGRISETIRQQYANANR